MAVMARRGRGAVLLIVVGVALGLAAVWTATAGAQSTSYSATLTGGAVVPPVTTTGSGTFTATATADALTYTLNATGTGITQAHIHVGAAGENGGVVAFLFGPEAAGVNTVATSGSLAAGGVIGSLAGDFAGLIAALNEGRAYVQVHTLANPPGELRGQVAAAASALPATGNGGLAAASGSQGPTTLAIILGLSGAGVVLAGGAALRRARGRAG